MGSEGGFGVAKGSEARDSSCALWGFFSSLFPSSDLFGTAREFIFSRCTAIG